MEFLSKVGGVQDGDERVRMAQEEVEGRRRRPTRARLRMNNRFRFQSSFSLLHEGVDEAAAVPMLAASVEVVDERNGRISSHTSKGASCEGLNLSTRILIIGEQRRTALKLSNNACCFDVFLTSGKMFSTKEEWGSKEHAFTYEEGVEIMESLFNHAQIMESMLTLRFKICLGHSQRGIIEGKTRRWMIHGSTAENGGGGRQRPARARLKFICEVAVAFSIIVRLEVSTGPVEEVLKLKQLDMLVISVLKFQDSYDAVTNAWHQQSVMKVVTYQSAVPMNSRASSFSPQEYDAVQTSMYSAEWHVCLRAGGDVQREAEQEGLAATNAQQTEKPKMP